MANLNPTPLTQQDFGNLWFHFPRSTRGGARGGLSRNLPAGGTEFQYHYIQAVDIATHDMSIAVGFMTTYIETECARLNIQHNGRGAFTRACRRALLAAWNASNHLAPGGGLLVWANERTPEEQLMDSRWADSRQKMITKIINTGPQNPAPAPTPGPMYQIPQWYINQLAAIGVPAPVQS